MDNDYGTKVFTDEDGKQWLMGENGNFLRDEWGNKIPPMRTTKTETSSGFTTYDTSQGHCAFCGSLTCCGGCFK